MQFPASRLGLFIRPVARTSAFLALIGILGLTWGDGAPQNITAMKTQSIPVAKPVGCAGDPTLPPLLQVDRDAADPDRIHVKVLGSIGAAAKVTVDGDQPVAWDGGKAPAAFRLRKGDATRSFSMRSPMSDRRRAHHVRVGLELTDDQGRVWGHVNQEVDLGGGAAPAEVSKSTEVHGSSAEGAPVVASVPADAPAPVVTEAGQ